MAAADAVICRAGAMTLTEIAKMGKPAIIIPSPNVVDNHQYKNAKALADADAAVVITEDELSAEGSCKVSDAIKSFYEDEALRERMSDNVKAFAKQDVEKKIFETIENLLKTYNKILPKGE